MICSSSVQSAGVPSASTPITPTVRSVIAASTSAGSSVPVSGRTSTRTGVAPQYSTAWAVAGNV